MARRRSRDEWREIVGRWQRSGQSRSEFARAAGVNKNTLGWWSWKLRTEEDKPEPAFLDVVVEDPEPAPGFELDVHGIGVRVPPGFDAHELRRLVDALC